MDLFFSSIKLDDSWFCLFWGCFCPYNKRVMPNEPGTWKQSVVKTVWTCHLTCRLASRGSPVQPSHQCQYSDNWTRRIPQKLFCSKEFRRAVKGLDALLHFLQRPLCGDVLLEEHLIGEESKFEKKQCFKWSCCNRAVFSFVDRNCWKQDVLEEIWGSLNDIFWKAGIRWDRTDFLSASDVLGLSLKLPRYISLYS